MTEYKVHYKHYTTSRKDSSTPGFDRIKANSAEEACAEFERRRRNSGTLDQYEITHTDPAY